MAARAIAFLLLSIALHGAYSSPLPHCGCKSSSSTPAPAEEYNQNNGQPIVIALAQSSDASSSSSSSWPAPTSKPCPGPAPAPKPAPCPSPAPAPAPGCGSASEINSAQALADESISAANSETIPAPEAPCRVETSTEIVHTPGETFVHQPAEILINQPPTQLLIHHAPYKVKPSAIVLNTGSKKITNAYTTKYLGSPVHVRPVVVRIVKPIEKKIFIDKPQKPCASTYVANPSIPAPCDSADNGNNSDNSNPILYNGDAAAYDGQSYGYAADSGYGSDAGYGQEIVIEAQPYESDSDSQQPAASGCGCSA